MPLIYIFNEEYVKAMKLKPYATKLCMVFSLFLIFYTCFAQETKSDKLTAGADFYSTYIWRGTHYGTGPSVQPGLKLSTGIFMAGAWGSFDFNGYQETDIYFTFSLPAGFSLGMTDYYYPGLQYFDYSDTTGSHAFEINLGFSGEHLSVTGNYILNKAGGAGTKGGDIYAEARYTFKALYIFGGAGNGWHSTDNDDSSDKFTFCNLGVGVTKEIKITESFSIPMNCQLIFNPDREKIYIVAGFSF